MLLVLLIASCVLGYFIMYLTPAYTEFGQHPDIVAEKCLQYKCMFVNTIYYNISYLQTSFQFVSGDPWLIFVVLVEFTLVITW